MHMNRLLLLTLLLLLHSVLISGCATPVITPAPSPQASATAALPPKQPAPPTSAPRELLSFSDPLNDERRLPDGVACLPDYLDITQAVIARMTNGGLQVRFSLAAAIPTLVEPGNDGFDFSLYLGDDIVQPIMQFRVLAAGTRYIALYTTPNTPLQPNLGFSIQMDGSRLEMLIQPELLANLPASVTASIKTFYCPPDNQFCCDDFATSGRSFPLTLR